MLQENQDKGILEECCEADDGDARGRRHLLGGVVMVLSVLPRLEHRGKP
jgi:hypothetical protein